MAADPFDVLVERLSEAKALAAELEYDVTEKLIDMALLDLSNLQSDST